MERELAHSQVKRRKRNAKSSLVQSLLELSNHSESHRSSQRDDLSRPLDGSLVRSVLTDPKSESESLVSKSSLTFIDAPAKKERTKEESQGSLETNEEERRGELT